MIPFNKPAVAGLEEHYIKEAIERGHLSGDGHFTKMCSKWLEEHFLAEKVLLTTSCTHALEMAAILADIREGDEVILPSYTFVSTANAFALRGAKIIFVDIRPDTMNMDEKLIEQAITARTRAIVPVHYAGVACEMDAIMEIANRYNLVVIEDAAQGVISKYKGKYLGTIGHLGCYSFHETKNYNCGEGGALVINDARFIERAEIIREKGTNRARFFRGQVDKYSWVDIGSSYLPSELNAAFLYAQFENAERINSYRLDCWYTYFNGLKPLEDEEKIVLPFIPEHIDHNAHMFYLKTSNLEERTSLIAYLKSKGIQTVFHYIPLHSSQAGLEFGEMIGRDNYTTIESERLLRLPLYYNITLEEINIVINEIVNYYNFM
ncbi:dTDP-4-amino-4,6-dideoxygalactose transaminase [Paenibacillus brevis]|uniref:dTDP-4-amino-4,6-dideoxygalactose transaminase n=1 Tax=Paenibacillus brevis TaxID=2841508 RepID=A0ABS6FUA3_9BACL|nr:dTDP-4-amino-4,6-dideoxygalactose transaminase [Paenibacillus brevis]MBU5673836.1 dTDP-4-amino-4,6-dideoxygalactose transaminase [Paenibacillus brevis]